MHDARFVHVIKCTGQLEGAGPNDQFRDKTKVVIVFANDPSQISAGGQFQADFQFGIRIIPPQTSDDIRMIQFLYDKKNTHTHTNNFITTDTINNAFRATGVGAYRKCPARETLENAKFISKIGRKTRRCRTNWVL